MPLLNIFITIVEQLLNPPLHEVSVTNMNSLPNVLIVIVTFFCLNKNCQDFFNNFYK